MEVLILLNCRSVITVFPERSPAASCAGCILERYGRRLAQVRHVERV
jgi:hypothetical protein